MIYLTLVSLLWAFSFGLIGSALVGLDAFFIATVRLGLALLIFLPFLRTSSLPRPRRWRLVGCGAIQFGLMYVSYIQAYQYLPSHLVALFSVLTPIYVVLIHDIRQRKWTPFYLLAAALSVIGAGIIQSKPGQSEGLWTGFALMQLSGVAFAFGQVYYRDWKRQHPGLADRQVFALLYAGGFAFALLISLLRTDWTNLSISPKQWAVLLYLGSVASGLGFFLWNKGAARARAGTLAAFNNAVVPLAMFCSLFVFGEIDSFTTGGFTRLALGTVLIGAALLLAEQHRK